MQSMQKKIMLEFEKLLKETSHEEDDLTISGTSDFSNVGTLYVQHGFYTYFEIFYNFQSSYMNLTMTGPAVFGLKSTAIGHKNDVSVTRNERGQSTASWSYLEYNDSVRMIRMFQSFTQVVRRTIELFEDEEDVDDACPGCGCKPGDGVTDGCTDDSGCGASVG